MSEHHDHARLPVIKPNSTLARDHQAESGRFDQSKYDVVKLFMLCIPNERDRVDRQQSIGCIRM